jgi:hypothetical protein
MELCTERTAVAQVRGGEAGRIHRLLVAGRWALQVTWHQHLIFSGA